jgi:hypothetical protein
MQINEHRIVFEQLSTRYAHLILRNKISKAVLSVILRFTQITKNQNIEGRGKCCCLFNIDAVMLYDLA